MPFSLCLKTSLYNLKLLIRAVRSSSCRTETTVIVKMHPAFSNNSKKPDRKNRFPNSNITTGFQFYCADVSWLDLPLLPVWKH